MGHAPHLPLRVRPGIGTLNVGLDRAHVIAASVQQAPDILSAWGRDDHIYWLSTAGPVDPTHTNPNQALLIGSDTSTWVFQLIATSPEELDALTEALAGALSVR